MLKKRYISLFVLFVILLLLFTGVFRFGTDEEQPPETGAGNAEITYDSYALDVSTVIYNAEGSIDYTLRAARQVHYLNEVTLLEQPYLQLNRPSGSSWHLVADSGRILPAGETADAGILPAPGETAGPGPSPSGEIELIELDGNVQLYQSPQSGDRTRLQTEFMILYPDAEQLETDRLVTVNVDGLEQSARGMFADLREERLIFRTDVRGHYAPQR